jgi:kynureninase
MRVAPAPLYNTAVDVLEFVTTLKAALAEVAALAAGTGQ